MLTDQEIERITGASKARASMWLVASSISRAVEAEVRAQDTALIQQLVEAVQTGFDQTCSVGRQKDWTQLSEALAAGRARLKETL